MTRKVAIRVLGNIGTSHSTLPKIKVQLIYMWMEVILRRIKVVTVNN
jgi:hypothetical protein